MSSAGVWPRRADTHRGLFIDMTKRYKTPSIDHLPAPKPGGRPVSVEIAAAPAYLKKHGLRVKEVRWSEGWGVILVLEKDHDRTD